MSGLCLGYVWAMLGYVWKFVVLQKGKKLLVCFRCLFSIHRAFAQPACLASSFLCVSDVCSRFIWTCAKMEIRGSAERQEASCVFPMSVLDSSGMTAFVRASLHAEVCRCQTAAIIILAAPPLMRNSNSGNLNKSIRTLPFKQIKNFVPRVLKTSCRACCL